MSKTSEELLTWIVFLGGLVLWKKFSLQLSVFFVLGQPSSVREVPFLAERRAVDHDVLQEPRSSTAGVVVTDPTHSHHHNHNTVCISVRILRSHGMNKSALQTVYHSVVISKFLYAAPAWCGFPHQQTATVLHVLLTEAASVQLIIRTFQGWLTMLRTNFFTRYFTMLVMFYQCFCLIVESKRVKFVQLLVKSSYFLDCASIRCL